MSEAQYVESVMLDLMNKDERLFSYTHRELVNHAYRWVLKSGGCGVAFRELVTANPTGEIPDVIGFANWKSVLIECKASRADFLKDKQKKFRLHPEYGMGKYRYYCCPHGLIKPNELPERWGLIWVAKKAIAVVKADIKNPFERNVQAEQCLMYSALRRLHLRGRVEEIYESLSTEKITEL